MDLIWRKIACAIQNTRGQHLCEFNLREFTACENKSTLKISTFTVIFSWQKFHYFLKIKV